MKLQDAYALIQQLKETFDEVWLVDPTDRTAWDVSDAGLVCLDAPCYALWGKAWPCDRCIAGECCASEKKRSRLETMDGKRCHVVYRALEIEGRKFVLEIVSVFSYAAQETPTETPYDLDTLLASGYHAVISVDMETGVARPLRFEEETGEMIGIELDNGEASFEQIYAAIVEKFVLEQDKEMMQQLGRFEVIREKLAVMDTYAQIFLSDITGKVHYWEIEIKAVPHAPGTPLREALICFTDKDTVVRATEKFKKDVGYALSRADMYFSALFSQAYGFFRINVSKDAFITPLYETRDGKGEKVMDSVIREYSGSFTGLMSYYADHRDCSEPEAYRRFMTAENLLHCFETGQSNPQLTCWVNTKEKGRRYLRHLFFLTQEATTGDVHATCVLYDITDEKRAQLSREKESENVFHLIRALSERYEYVYYVRARSGRYEMYAINAQDGELISHETLDGNDFFEDVINKVDGNILPEDCGIVLRLLNRENLERELESDGASVSCDFRVLIGNEPLWYRCKVSKYSNVIGHVRYIVGLQNIEDVKRSELERQRNQEIIQVLATQYSSIYYIDLRADRVLVCTTNRDPENELDKIFRDDIPYTEAFENYVSRRVYDADREMVLSAGSISNILSQLAAEKTFVTTYRAGRENSPRYSEMKFVKVDDAEDVPTAAVLAFMDRDVETRRRFVYEKLMEEYEGVNLVDLDEDVMRVILKSKYYHADSSLMITPYSAEILDYAMTKVDPNYRETWINMSDPDYMRRYLAREDRREVIYSVGGQNKGWRRAVAQVIERRNGVPVNFILTFTAIDASRAEMLALDAKIVEQKRALENQQKMLEQALIRAEAASQAKTVFLSNMSHDIRTPMNAIIGFTELAMQHINDHDKVQNYLTKTAVSSQYLLSLINDILDMSRIESGKLQLENVECTLPEIMRDLASIIHGQTQARRQYLYMDCFDVTDENVICDKLRLHQILINLLSNAVKFTPEGGTIRIKLFQIASTPTTGTYEFHVQDNGIGMSSEFVKKIFEPFERARTSTISKTQGTGLGMSITKNIVDMMHGKIHIISEEGKGSEFIVTLTFDLQKRRADYPPIAEIQNGRALVFDGDSESGDSITALLSRLGMRAERADTVDAMIAMADRGMTENDGYRLFVVNWRKRDNSGETIVRALRELAGPQLPIIAVTAFDWTSIEEQARAVGVSGFMQKPLFYSDMHKLFGVESGLQGAADEDQPDRGDFTGRNVLLVEDNELNREIATEILEERGFTVFCAENGAIAVQMVAAAQRDSYDLILMDVQMPVMNGYEATRRIRALPLDWVANLPIIAMTANAFVEDRKEALEAGMNEHIAKPISVDKLLGMLKRFV